MVQTEADRELDQLETFTPDMVAHIQEVYARLNAEREEWLKQKREEQL